MNENKYEHQFSNGWLVHIDHLVVQGQLTCKGEITS